ncbi:hypothetical protein GOODEAATRI_025424 [Goodea atripinnis]|uniref:FAK1-like FERM domain-containing protein n=1 Tax=Goodea atripinnis TaxID=208336 RepID=A0ABV0MWJ3_9TELE
MSSVCVVSCQPKQLRRLIQQTFQSYSTFQQDQCMAKFFTTLSQCYSITEESYGCQLVPICLAKFSDIRSISCTAESDGRALLTVHIQGSKQPLAVNTSSLAVAENMADLIDGYCRLEGKAESSLMVRPNKGTIT